MYWEHPHYLWSLWIVLPVVAGLLVYAHRKRLATAQLFAERAMLGRLLPAGQPARPWLKAGAIVLGIGLLVFAAAGPRFGVYFQEVAQRGADVFVLLDVSRSMTAEDVAPSRLERAKSDIRDLLARVRGDRVGLIAFAGKAEVKVPLTNDQGFFEMMLDEIDTTSAPRGGTCIGDAIRKAIEALPERTDRDQALVLITDGEDHESYPEEAARAAAERGIRIFTVGMGDTTEGARIPVRDESGNLRYMRYAGKEVWSKADEGLLAKLAILTGGAYIPAGTKAYDLGQVVYEDHLASLARGEYQSQERRRYHERFQWFAAAGLALLLAQMAVGEYGRGDESG